MHIENGDPVWIELKTPDVAGAQDFYGEFFGWRFERFSTDRIMAFAGEHPVATLVERPVDEAQWRVFLKVESISDATTQAASSRGHILLSPTSLDDGRSRFAFVEDPAGGVVGLMETGEFPGFVIGTDHGQPTWFEVGVRDFRAALRFYHDVVGWRYHYVDEAGIMSTQLDEDTRFATNGPAGEATAGIVAEEDSAWRVFVAVDKLPTGMADPVDGHLGRQVQIRDPQGGRLIVLEAGD